MYPKSCFVNSGALLINADGSCSLLPSAKWITRVEEFNSSIWLCTLCERVKISISKPIVFNAWANADTYTFIPPDFPSPGAFRGQVW